MILIEGPYLMSFLTRADWPSGRHQSISNSL
jgi:hypothetical protein